MAATLPTLFKLPESPIISDNLLISTSLRFNPSTWITGLPVLLTIKQTMPTSINGQQPLTMVVDDLDLPTAARRWKISLPKHPEVTFQNLQEGKLPELTDEEMQERFTALDIAEQVRAELDIRPLTTTVVIRQIRAHQSQKD